MTHFLNFSRSKGSYSKATLHAGRDEIESNEENSLTNMEVPDVPKETQHLCDTCDESFTTAEILSMHKETEHGDEDLFNLFVCSEFTLERKKDDNLKKHRFNEVVDKINAEMVTNEKEVCDMCHKTFKNMNDFLLHMETHNDCIVTPSVTTENKPSICSVCHGIVIANDRSFSNKEQHGSTDESTTKTDTDAGQCHSSFFPPNILGVLQTDISEA